VVLLLAKITQLGIILENKPRSLARLCSTLGKRGVNIVALYAPERARGGKVRVWVDKPDEAKSALKTAKIRFSEEEVLAMGLDNRAGTFGEVAEKLGRAKINIKYAYSATAEGSINAVVILAVSNVSKALNVLRADTRTKQ
jgi:hypothetical protein